MAARVFGQFGDPVVEVADVVAHLLVVIDGVDRGADRMKQRKRRPLRPDQDLGAHGHGDGEGGESFGKDGTRETVIELIGDDADDQHPSVAAGSGDEVRRLGHEFRHPDGVAHGIPVGKIAPGQGLIDHDEGCAAMLFG